MNEAKSSDDWSFRTKSGLISSNEPRALKPNQPLDNSSTTLYTDSILCASNKILPAFECWKQGSRWKFSVNFSMGQPCTRSLWWYVYIHFCLHCFLRHREISWFICRILVEQVFGTIKSALYLLQLAKPRNGTLTNTRQYWWLLLLLLHYEF